MEVYTQWYVFDEEMDFVQMQEGVECKNMDRDKKKRREGKQMASQGGMFHAAKCVKENYVECLDRKSSICGVCRMFFCKNVRYYLPNRSVYVCMCGEGTYNNYFDGS